MKNLIPLLVVLLGWISTDSCGLSQVTKPKANSAVQFASRPQFEEEFEPIYTLPPLPDASESSSRVALDGLTLADIIASTYRTFPLIEQARLEADRTSGELLSSYGFYDLNAESSSTSEPTGFYRNYRNGIGVARQTWWGGYLSAGYRIGRGNFQPWYLERETDKGGEFKLGVGVPLLQGSAIDPQRVAVFQASLANQAADPFVQQTILNVCRDAALAYWDWVAAGASLLAQRDLLEIAERRGKQFEAGFAAGKFAEIDLVLNRQLIAERKGTVLATEQQFQSTAIKLSLFLRDGDSQPIVPATEWLPVSFPVIEPISDRDYPSDLRGALARRPELQLIELELEQLKWDRRLASNGLLPRLDVVAEGSQDVGEAASSSDDKSQYETIIGLQGEVPLQRRRALGQIRSSSVKIQQLSQKLRFQQDKIGAELQIALNSLAMTTEIHAQAELAFSAAVESLSRFRFAFEQGKLDLISLNLLESKANESELRLVNAQRNWFAALADLQTALALDPLDQAVIVSALPASTRPDQGQLPEPQQPVNEVIE